MRRSVIHFALLLLIPFFISASAGGREKEGNTINGTDTGSAEISEDTEDAGADAPEKSGSKQGAVPGQDGEKRGAGDVIKTEKRAPDAGSIRKEHRKKQAIKEDGAVAEKEAVREQRDDLLLVDHQSMRYGRIPGITIKKEDSPDNAIVKIPEDKITGKTKDKKPKGGLFGSSTDTVAKVGLLIFIIIVLIIYKTRTKKSKRRVVRTLPKR
ncbi:MAG: hypothetical protein A2W19_07175 [Spirochaetes bacterium RBG_16_49_21]|nr:MAG: hypothetical protein A2W19_07175 [Spirochaetes bacterium RBG_16_49_21]